MNIDQQIQSLQRFLPAESLKAHLALPTKLVNEPLQALIPSLTLDSDGPTLTSLFLFTEHYLGEIRVASGNEQDFDFTQKARLLNVRVKYWTHEVKRDRATFQLAQVTLKHDAVNVSELYYVGDERDSWLSAILASIPMQALVAS